MLIPRLINGVEPSLFNGTQIVSAATSPISNGNTILPLADSKTTRLPSTKPWAAAVSLLTLATASLAVAAK
ncbi:unannotated protein [freshwater metagenome]|uniref:Unannotated protein n=1 Tax=freshwater metagenome TaxID=449393 RepID=A0A6J6F3P1_9ZZZZ